MPSRRDQPPAPAELLAWLAVPAPPFASGVFLSEADTVAFGYVSSGEPPVLVTVPSHRPVVFAHEAPDRWRLEVDGALLAMSDGNSAVGVALRQSEAPGEVLHVGRELRLVNGPDVLLRPDPPALLHDVEQWHRDPRDERGQLAVGDVVADEVLGRACWRWSSPYGTWWLDTQTGVLLRVVTPSGSARFLELDVLQPPASDRFVIAVDVLSRAVPVPDPFEERHHEAGAVSPISLGLTLDVFPDSAGEAEHADRPGSDGEVATAQPGPRPGAALRGAPTGDTDFHRLLVARAS